MKTPAADRKVLIIVAGAVWLFVGVALTFVSIYWLRQSSHGIIIAGSAGVCGGLIVGQFGFGKIAEKNMHRIREFVPHKEKICVFAFQNTRSYFLVLIMMSAGYLLRHLPVEKIYLVPVYLALGVGLVIASLKYLVPQRVTSK